MKKTLSVIFWVSGAHFVLFCFAGPMQESFFSEAEQGRWNKESPGEYLLPIGVNYCLGCLDAS